MKRYNQGYEPSYCCVLASFPGHFQIVKFSLQLHDKIWEWPGNEASCMHVKVLGLIPRPG